ncbi:oligosaccharide flippase family protein [Antribacter gilvus]|uniref:oligosaccharide flippase family protein n=1 Tax=Antribacter gilvus TaxID=2304675 RepID=UPI000F782998|nr:oligosaccharide flippase family protein [Antribacter gilvus]
MTGTSTTDRNDLGRTAVRGGTWTVAGQALRALMQLAGLVVLARLLSPTDFGYLAMVVAVIGVGEVIRDAGLANAAVQARELTQGQRSNLFWLNSALGAAFTAAVVALAPLIAGLYDEPRLVEVSRWLAPAHATGEGLEEAAARPATVLDTVSSEGAARGAVDAGGCRRRPARPALLGGGRRAPREGSARGRCRQGRAAAG